MARITACTPRGDAKFLHGALHSIVRCGFLNAHEDADRIIVLTARHVFEGLQFAYAQGCALRRLLCAQHAPRRFMSVDSAPMSVADIKRIDAVGAKHKRATNRQRAWRMERYVEAVGETRFSGLGQNLELIGRENFPKRAVAPPEWQKLTLGGHEHRVAQSQILRAEILHSRLGIMEHRHRIGRRAQRIDVAIPGTLACNPLAPDRGA